MDHQRVKMLSYKEKTILSDLKQIISGDNMEEGVLKWTTGSRAIAKYSKQQKKGPEEEGWIFTDQIWIVIFVQQISQTFSHLQG